VPGIGLRDIDSLTTLLILDGLDKTHSGPYPSRAVDLFEEIRSLDLRECHLLVTARSHLFARNDQVWGIPSFDTWPSRKEVTTRDLFSVCEVLDFNEDQPAEYIRRRTDLEQIFASKVLQSIYGLTELARRPLFMKMFVESGKSISVGDQRHMMWSLYSQYTRNASVLREKRTGIEADCLEQASIMFAREVFRRKG
jgi:hypothetical protein